MMDKYQILALMMRAENQFDADMFTLAAMLAEQIETVSERLSDQDVARLIQVGGALYRLGVEKYGAAVELEDLFPACENWPAPHPHRGGFRH